MTGSKMVEKKPKYKSGIYIRPIPVVVSVQVMQDVKAKKNTKGRVLKRNLMLIAQLREGMKKLSTADVS